MTLPRFVTISAIALSVLLIPLIGMQVSTEVNWTLFDFLLMGGMLLALGFGIEWSVRKSKSKKGRMLLIFTFLLAFILLWAEIAVGIFGSPIAGN